MLALPLACGGKSATSEGSGGTTNEASGGSAQIPPAGCTYDGKRYASGDAFPSTDGCNSCSCDKGNVACTTKACIPISCDQVEMFYDQMLQDAKKCDPHDPNACTLRVGNSLGCGCETFVNASSWNPDMAGAYTTHYSRLNCGGGATCGPCNPPLRGVCTVMQGCMDSSDPGGGRACKVAGVVYPDGTSGIPDPISCNTCACKDGTLSCAEMNCPKPCPMGTKLAKSCAECGPTDACEVVETSCRPICTDICAEGICIDGACLVGVCG